MIPDSEEGCALGVTLGVDHLNTVPKKEVLTVGSGAVVPGCRQVREATAIRCTIMKTPGVYGYLRFLDPVIPSCYSIMRSVHFSTWRPRSVML
jgi:hypothetical protein